MNNDEVNGDEISHWVEARREKVGTIPEESTRTTKKKKKESTKFVPIVLSPATTSFTIGDVDDIVQSWSTYPGYVVAFDEFEREKNGNILSYTDVTKVFAKAVCH